MSNLYQEEKLVKKKNGFDFTVSIFKSFFKSRDIKAPTRSLSAESLLSAQDVPHRYIWQIQS